MSVEGTHHLSEAFISKTDKTFEASLWRQHLTWKSYLDGHVGVELWGGVPHSLRPDGQTNSLVHIQANSRIAHHKISDTIETLHSALYITDSSESLSDFHSIPGSPFICLFKKTVGLFTKNTFPAAQNIIKCCRSSVVPKKCLEAESPFPFFKNKTSYWSDCNRAQLRKFKVLEAAQIIVQVYSTFCLYRTPEVLQPRTPSFKSTHQLVPL